MSEELNNKVPDETTSSETNQKWKKEKQKKSVGQEILEWILTLVIAVVAALAIRTFIFEPVKVDGGSMNDTLADGEIMFVSKFDYSTAWLSFPWMSDESKENCKKFTIGGNPERFDVVICRYPGRGDTNFVKRVIGLPGDTISLQNGLLYILDADGNMVIDGLKEEYVSDEYRVRGGSDGLNFGPKTIPEGCYFVMGDHRNNSNDSRAQGPISRDMIVGHVRTVVFPFNKWRNVN